MITRDHFFFNGTKGFYCGKETRVTGVWECVKKKCLSKAKGRPKPPLRSDTVTRLRQFYLEHNRVFYAMVGRDFGWPSRPEQLAPTTTAHGNNEREETTVTKPSKQPPTTAAPPYM